MEKFKQILQLLPYAHPFCFVDELTHVDHKRVEGNYRFKKDEYFYQGHFKDNPVTPGVILTECMAQIGLVCIGIHLLIDKASKSDGEKRIDLLAEVEAPGIVFTESHIIFEKPVWPGERVRVISNRMYWRLGKLKCKIEMYNDLNERVCYGELAGIIQK